MHIVFITPTTTLRRNPAYRLGGKLYGQPNSITGPLILGGICKRAGHQVEVYEELNGGVNYKKIMPTVDVVCISIMTSNAPRGYELADLFHKHSHARVIMGGMHATWMPEEALEHADQVIVGEGETVILDVVEGRNKDRIVKGPIICDLDTVPFPDYSILKTPVTAANVISTRGCPYRCTFCTTSRMFAPYRQRSIENVMKEIRMYKDIGFKYMNFEDDNFTADKERAKEICRRMIRENLTFKETFFFGRTDLAKDEEMLTLLHDAHLTRVLIGIESLNQKSLDRIHKGQNIQDIRDAAEACAKHHIRLIASIVLGIDDDSIEDMNRTIAFTKEIHAYQLQPAVLTPFPGTPVYDQFRKEGRILDTPWSSYDMMNVNFVPAQMSPWELQDEFYEASNRFYTLEDFDYLKENFGMEYAMRRLGFATMARMGTSGARWAADHVKATSFYKLKHNEIKALPPKEVHTERKEEKVNVVRKHTEKDA